MKLLQICTQKAEHSKSNFLKALMNETWNHINDDVAVGMYYNLFINQTLLSDKIIT